MTDAGPGGWVALLILVGLVLVALCIIAFAALLLRREQWHRIRLGIFIDRNGHDNNE